MNREAWQHIVHEARQGNESPFSKAVTSNFVDYFSSAINKTVQDEALTRDIYNSTMLKFWERFILKGEELPETNIKGYIYQMAKNAFYEMRRKTQTKKHGFITTTNSLEIVEKYSTIVNQSGTIDKLDVNNQTETAIRCLHETIQSLDETCKQIIEQNILQKTTLTVLKDELGIHGSYNAIVQKKKRCLHILKKKLLKHLKQNSINIEQLIT